MKKTSLPLILGAAATALVLLLAAVLPALFVREEREIASQEPLSAGERAELFALYWAEDERCTVERLDPENFGETELAEGREAILRLQDKTCFDRGVRLTENSGERFYALYREDGRGLRMREFYEQSAGDWSNWFRVFADMDTGEVYFLYQSSKCLQHPSMYPAREIVTGARAVAEEWGGCIGYEHCAVLSGGENAVSAVYVRGDDALYYDTSYTAYTTPEYVVDFRIVMQPPLAEDGTAE